MIDVKVKKEIVRNLHAAIDSELLKEDNRAYVHYIESLSLVLEELKKDIDSPTLSSKDKWNLTEFAHQSIKRVALIVKQEETPGPAAVSAPPESEISFNIQEQSTRYNPHYQDEPENMIMARYHRRLGMASSAIEKQNLELELARQLVEKAAITRNRLMHATAWAMQSAHKKFKIQDKLHNGSLLESDFKMQQLYALALQFNHGNSWLAQLTYDLQLYPQNVKLVRELLENILTDNAHPIKSTMNQMQDKIYKMIIKATNDQDINIKEQFEDIEKVLKEDLHILKEVLKALYEPLNTEKNASLTSEVLYHVYYSQLKQSLISIIRLVTKDVESKLNDIIKEELLKKQLNRFETSDSCKEAITKFHYLTTLHNPYDMLDCTVQIIKLLADSDFDKQHYTSIGADDLLPRLCQVVIHSGIPSICAEAFFMESFMPAEKALGEEGYALTMLQSAIAHLVSESYQ